MQNRTYSVGQAAAILGVSVKTLQRYDEQNLLPAHRNEKGRRYYLEEDIQKFNFVKKNYGYQSNYSAKQFCNMIGISEHYLAQLDRLGVIKPNKTESGYRYYTEADKIKYFHQCKLNKTNFSNVTEIKETFSIAEMSRRLNVSVSKLKCCGYDANIRPGIKHFQFYTNLDEDNLCYILFDYA